MNKLSKKYLLDHTANIQNFDSFGRNLAQALLEAAAAEVDAKRGSSRRVELSVRFVVQPNHMECVTISVQGPLGLGGGKNQPPPIPPPITMHVGNI
jgi:hypothetical protein